MLKTDLMTVELLDYMPKLSPEDCEKFMNEITSQSRSLKLKNIDSLFDRVKKQGHHLSEFTSYIFKVSNFSEVVLKQWTRHRIGWSWNVSSGRHTIPILAVVPEKIKRFIGIIEFEDDKLPDIEWSVEGDGNFYTSYDPDTYKNIIDIEDIRYCYPQALTKNCVAKCNGESLRHFLKLRLDSHAQYEIQQLAFKMYELVKKVHPFIIDDLQFDTLDKFLHKK